MKTDRSRPRLSVYESTVITGENVVHRGEIGSCVCFWEVRIMGWWVSKLNSLWHWHTALSMKMCRIGLHSEIQLVAQISVVDGQRIMERFSLRSQKREEEDSLRGFSLCQSATPPHLENSTPDVSTRAPEMFRVCFQSGRWFKSDWMSRKRKKKYQLRWFRTVEITNCTRLAVFSPSPDLVSDLCSHH